MSQEIYPPKLHEFAYVTDGACDEQQILDQELVMLKVSERTLWGSDEVLTVTCIWCLTKWPVGFKFILL